MDKTKNLKKFITRATLLIVAIMVAAYTLLIQFSLLSVMIDAGTYDLELTARDFARDYRINKATPLPHDRYLTSYLDAQQLPNWFTKRHNPQKLKHGKLVFGELKTPEPYDDENIFYLGMAYQLDEQKSLFMIQSIKESDDLPNSFQNLERTQLLTLTAGIAFISLMGIALWLFFRQISKPILTLEEWATDLDSEKLSKAPPSFKFDEMNHLAKFIQNSAVDLKEALDREHQFLRNASHELRTPIAVIRSNIDLLDRLQPDSQSKANASYQRIRRAADNMQQLTETLLWLSRKEDAMPEAEQIDIVDLVTELIEDNTYLLSGKNVRIHQSFKNLIVSLPQTATRITISNLIRNAFQYTTDGTIEISTEHDTFMIKNAYSDPLDGSTAENYGYGLGLMLVQQICDRLNIVYQNETTPDGFHATLKFFN